MFTLKGYLGGGHEDRRMRGGCSDDEQKNWPKEFYKNPTNCISRHSGSDLVKNIPWVYACLMYGIKVNLSLDDSQRYFIPTTTHFVFQEGVVEIL